MIHTNDGQTLRATEPEAIVAELNDLSFSPEKTPGKFMTESAGRILAFSGQKVTVPAPRTRRRSVRLRLFLSTEEEPERHRRRQRR